MQIDAYADIWIAIRIDNQTDTQTDTQNDMCDFYLLRELKVSTQACSTLFIGFLSYIFPLFVCFPEGYEVRNLVRKQLDLIVLYVCNYGQERAAEILDMTTDEGYMQSYVTI